MKSSREHELYLKKLKKEKIIITIFRITIILLFIITWELLSYFNIINTFLFSSPSRIINTIIKLYNSNDLFKHIYITLSEVLISFSLASIFGIIIATIMWRFKMLSKIIDPYITVINSLPKVALQGSSHH